MESTEFTPGVRQKIGNVKKINDYCIVRQIGEGASASVFLCERNGDAFVRTE
jgi:hypothetical protein